MMDRRGFLRLMGGTAVLPLAPTWIGSQLVQAQGATALTNLGLPELTVTLTDTEYQVSPATTTAGWTLLTFDNQQQTDNSADIMLLPPGESIESMLEAVASPSAAPPAWIYETSFAGAPWVPAGTSAQAVVLLTAGEWVVFSPAPLTPASLTVTGRDATQAAPSSLTADLEVTMQEYAFLGLDNPVHSRQQLWKVTNVGHQPHLMTLGPLPSGTTQAQFMDSLTAMMTGTPTADAIDLGSMATIAGCSSLSTDQSLYLALDLPVGTYGAICFFPDEQTGAPHVMLGMAQVFTVA
jgi:hypothetical protein